MSGGCFRGKCLRGVSDMLLAGFSAGFDALKDYGCVAQSSLLQPLCKEFRRIREACVLPPRRRACARASRARYSCVAGLWKL